MSIRLHVFFILKYHDVFNIYNTFGLYAVSEHRPKLFAFTLQIVISIIRIRPIITNTDNCCLFAYIKIRIKDTINCNPECHSLTQFLSLGVWLANMLFVGLNS